MSADKAKDDKPKPKKPKKLKGTRLATDLAIAYVVVAEHPVSSATVR